MKTKVNSLEIIYCKNCKHFRYKKINECSEMFSCAKENSVDIDRPELRCNMPCYQKKYYKKKVLKKS